MKKHSRVRFIALFLVGLVLTCGLLQLAQRGVDRSRQGLLATPDISARDRLIELGATVMLGSFRTIVVDWLWYRAAILKEQRQWVELDGVIRLIAKFQPTDIAAYNFQVWNMAYNIQYDAPTAAEAWKWVSKAIELGERGAERNRNHPNIWRLYCQIARVYWHRCAFLKDARARYFEKRVKEKLGKNPYLLAAEWFEKAWNAAPKTGANKANVHHLSMWAYTYDNLARELEKQGKIEEMIRWREEAIEKHRTIMREFPEYVETGQEAIADLRRLIHLHQDAQRADRLREKHNLAEETKLRLEITRRWSDVLRKNRFSEEARRNVNRSADDLESVLSRLTDPEQTKKVRSTILRTRYLAADPKFSSAEATKKLEAAVLPYDRQLGEAPSSPQLLRNKDIVRRISRIWHRIIANSPGNEKRARKAETAIKRYDSLLQLLPEAERKEQLDELADHWLTLLTSSDIDTALGRRRVKQAALRYEKRLLPLCPHLAAFLVVLAQRSKAGASAAIQKQMAGEISALTMQIHHLADKARDYWSALLQKDEPYADVAGVAERHLRTVAESLEKVIEAAEATLGSTTDVRNQRDPRSLVYWTRRIWRTLHEFDPRNVTYLQKAHQSAKRAPRRTP